MGKSDLGVGLGNGLEIMGGEGLSVEKGQVREVRMGRQ